MTPCVQAAKSGAMIRNAPTAARHAACAGRRPARPVATAAAAAAAPEPQGAAAPLALSRRQLLGATVAAGMAAGTSASSVAGGWAAPPPAEALELAPLGAVERVGGDKLVGLSPDQVKARELGGGEGGSFALLVAC